MENTVSISLSISLSLSRPLSLYLSIYLLFMCLSIFFTLSLPPSFIHDLHHTVILFYFASYFPLLHIPNSFLTLLIPKFRPISASPRSVITGHLEQVDCVAINGDQGCVLSASRNSTLLLHKITGELLRKIEYVGIFHIIRNNDLASIVFTSYLVHYFS